jgi:hypothetical protein
LVVVTGWFSASILAAFCVSLAQAEARSASAMSHATDGAGDPPPVQNRGELARPHDTRIAASEHIGRIDSACEVSR